MSHAGADSQLPELFGDDQWRRIADRLELPPRQRQVARLVCRAYTNNMIAADLGVSADTVRLHLKQVFRRLDVGDRVGLVVRLAAAAHDEEP